MIKKDLVKCTPKSVCYSNDRDTHKYHAIKATNVSIYFVRALWALLRLLIFQLLYYEADSDFANAMRPSWDENAYRHIDVIAADRVFDDINEPVVNSEIRSIPVSMNGVYFAFYDQVSLSLAQLAICY